MSTRFGSGGGAVTPANARSGTATVAVAGTTVTFSSAFADANWKMVANCFESDGSPVIFTITSKTASGFVCTPTTAGTLNYYATT